MSLDLYLHADKPFKREPSSGIFVRENGQTKEITRKEWDRRNPGREPIAVRWDSDETTVLYHGNITHNLVPMAKAAGVYELLWYAGENDFVKAAELIKPLEKAIYTLNKYPERFRPLNPENGWGSYEVFIRFLEGVLAACYKWKDARMESSR